MWIELSHFAAILALMTALVQWFAPVVGVLGQQPAWIRVGRQAVFATFILLTLSSAGLILSFIQHDFSVKYVAQHASLRLPFFYLVTAMWGGHEGSLLLWAWLLSLFVAYAAWIHWSTHTLSLPWLTAILGALQSGFLLLVIFLSSPFQRLFPAPADGMDLNPLLQDPGMVFHPPFLYMGYVGFAIPFAFAMAALINGRSDEEWILATRRWTLFSWAMLTTGIVFGAYWAYYELGWGGFWAWDPVENASFMPWLTATAFLHSVMVQERRRLFKIWNLFLIIATFSLSLLGTFLVRSGVLSSVHAFATDPGRGVFILGFISVVLIFSFGLLVLRSDALQTPARLDSLLSRESAFLFNNLVLVCATLTVLLGTLYPLAVETLSSAKVSVGAPYYNKVFIPIMLALLLLMALGSFVPWRQMAWPRFRRQLILPLSIGLIGLPLALLLAIDHPYGIATVMLILFAATTHLRELATGTKLRREREHCNWPTAFFRLINRNKRRYGGFVVHFGILLMAAGFIGSGLFREERTLTMQVGDSTQVGAWHFTMVSREEVAKYNWQAEQTTFRVTHRDGQEFMLKPQKRVYYRSSMPTTEAAIHNSWLEDIYIVLGDATENGFTIRIYRTPLMAWVWWGAGLMALGVFFALLQGRSLPRLKPESGATTP